MAEQIEILVVDDDKEIGESCRDISVKHRIYYLIKHIMPWMDWHYCRSMILNWQLSM